MTHPVCWQEVAWPGVTPSPEGLIPLILKHLLLYKACTIRFALSPDMMTRGRYTQQSFYCIVLSSPKNLPCTGYIYKVDMEVVKSAVDWHGY